MSTPPIPSRSVTQFTFTLNVHFKAKMHQNRFWLGLCPRPLWGAYSAPPDPLAGFKGPTYKGRGGERKRRGEEGREGEGRGREGRGGDGGEGRRVDARPVCLLVLTILHGYGPGRVPGFAISYLTVEK